MIYAMASIGILGFIGASQGSVVRFISLGACVWILVYWTYGSSPRRSTRNNMWTVGTNLPLRNCSLGTTIHRKAIYRSWKPARAIHSDWRAAPYHGLRRTGRASFSTDTRYNESVGSARTRELPCTDANASRKGNGVKALGVFFVHKMNEPKQLVVYDPAFALRQKTSSLAGDVGETRKAPGDNTLGKIVSAPATVIDGRKFFILEDSTLPRFEDLVSTDSLRSAWVQLKSNPGMLTRGATEETLHKLEATWFEQTSKALIKGDFKYPHQRRIQISKPAAKRPLTISNPRIKVIERAILNGIEPLFEGAWSWHEISMKEYQSLAADPLIPNNDIKKTVKKAFKKYGNTPHASMPRATASVHNDQPTEHLKA